MLVKTRMSKCLACGGKTAHKELKSGGKTKIRIKPSKRGSFTAWCKKKGYGGVTSSCISAGKNSSSTAIRKKATFAGSARKWKHELGGKLTVETAANLF